jgi:uncharacterized membrane protein YhiD involved in acid resistance
LLAVLFGGLVGVERIITKHDAEIGTHMLVAMLIFHLISSRVQKKTKYADENVRVNICTEQNLKEIIDIADEIGLKTL